MSYPERPTLTDLQLGTWVGHANPELADWRGVITANGRGRWLDIRPNGTDARVAWHAGTCGDGSALAGTKPGFFPLSALTIAGQCPDCARPAHYVFPGNSWDRSEGWHHDARHDSMTCWAGKAAHEARQAARSA